MREEPGESCGDRRCRAAANDKQQIVPTLVHLARLPEALGTPQTLLADSGYFSAANVEACAQAAIAPLIAVGRAVHGEWNLVTVARNIKRMFALAEPDHASNHA